MGNKLSRYNIKDLAEELGIELHEIAGLYESYFVEMEEECSNMHNLFLRKEWPLLILVLTEHADKENVLKAREIGVAGYLRKPIQKDELIDRVKSILSDRN